MPFLKCVVSYLSKKTNNPNVSPIGNRFGLNKGAPKRLRFGEKAEKDALLFATRTSRAYLPALLVLAEKQSHLCAERAKP